MGDMLVKLYTLPRPRPMTDRLREQGVDIRRALAPEKHLVLDWVREHFSAHWASECDVTFVRQPIACWLAAQGKTLLGFACHDAVSRGFFGPTDVVESARGKGIATALLLASLQAMADAGFAYAIIGDAGPTVFYERTIGAIPIPDSTPGIYKGMLTGNG